MQRSLNLEHNGRRGWRRLLTCAALAPVLGAFVWPVSAGPQDATPSSAVVVGRLYGEDIAVKGAVSYESTYGMSTALLASGSDITVRSGRAQIELMHGGAVAICGPAHFTLLESGGAVTLALDYGRVRPQVDAKIALTVYTPMIVATPVAIGSDPRDLTVGLDKEGAMCTVPSRGAVRIEQQLSGQSLLVPQGGEITLNEGQLSALHSANGSCDCQLLVTRNMAPRSMELSMPVPNPAARPRPLPAAPPPPPPAAQPVYRVYLPPLTFDAKAPDAPPDPDPAHILMLRQAQPLAELNLGERPQPTAEEASDYSPPPPPRATPVQAKAPATQAKRRNILVRFFSAIFHRNRPHCLGSGCNDSGDSGN
jgi:hypothetical protein